MSYRARMLVRRLHRGDGNCPGFRRLVVICAFAMLPAVACTPHAPSPRSSGSASPPSLIASSQTSAVLEARAPAPVVGKNEYDWVESVRTFDFREVARRIDASPASEASKPEVRFARARAAMELHDYARARALLLPLARELPLLTDDIQSFLAECALEQGPFEEAAAYFGAKSDAESAFKAGLALYRDGKQKKARVALDRGDRLLGKSKDARAFALRVRLRALRAEVARALGDDRAAAADLRWLAIDAPASDPGKRAEGELAKLKPPVRLTAAQALDRARNLAEAGLLDDALQTIDKAAHCSGERPSASTLARARGLACYLSRSDYAKAATLLDQSAKLDPKKGAHDAFLAARARSRAQDDAGAIVRYEALARRYPKSRFAEEARYRAARLHFLLGQWGVATKAYRSYLASGSKHHPRRFADASRYELALALLASGRASEASRLFEDQVRAADDDFERATLNELAAVALEAAGDRAHAVERFRTVIRDRPLSFAALSSAARLASLGEPSPSALPDATTQVVGAKGSIEVELPPRAEFYRRIGFTLDAARALSLHETEWAKRYAPRGNEALCRAYGLLGAGADRYRVGRGAVKSDAWGRLPSDASRWAWECAYPTPFSSLVRSAEALRGLPPGLLHAVMRQESAFRPDVVSPANAIGLLQLLPSTATRVAREMGVDPTLELLTTPAYNVELGAYYLKKVLATFGGKVALAAAAYNAGPQAVSRWLETGEDLPLDVWVARIPFVETRGYVARVVGNLSRYEFLYGGANGAPKITLTLPKGLRAGTEDY